MKTKTRLQEIREELGLNRVQFAKIINKSKSMLVLYETKDYPIPDKVMIQAEDYLKLNAEFKTKWKKK